MTSTANRHPLTATPKKADAAALGWRSVPTAELVNELRRREGVKTTVAEPYQDVNIKVNGPAVVLVVTD